MSIIKIENLTHLYMPGTPYEKKALDEISLEIEKGEFIGIIGHTGSGKSTLVQHLNGLLKATSGTITVDGITVNENKSETGTLRRKVGLIFQYPEHQLFEDTVKKDVSFGPINMGFKDEELDTRVKNAIEQVGLDYDLVADRSPFEMSGGQKRRVAIAGVLAMNPSILVLDEPTAGLDPAGSEEILGEIFKMHKANNLTTILISHDMEKIANYCDKILVMSEGKIAEFDAPEVVFSKPEYLRDIELDIPQVSQLMEELRKRGIDAPKDIYTIEKAEEYIYNILSGTGEEAND